MRELRFRQFRGGEFYHFDFTNRGFPKSLIGPLDKFPIEQFTGLLDKNGKEIYENDIVKMKGDMVGVVRWSEPLALFELITTIPIRGEEQYTATVYSKQNDKGWNLNREVIGNVHENPELL